MGAPSTLAPLRPALANGAPSIPESERPRRRHRLEAAGLVLVSCPRAYPVVGARRRRQRRAGRRQERGRSQSREARPAERSAAGCLDEVEKPVTALVVRRVPRSRRRRPACLRRCGRLHRCVASRGFHRGESRLRPSSRPPAPSAGACLGVGRSGFHEEFADRRLTCLARHEESSQDPDVGVVVTALLPPEPGQLFSGLRAVDGDMPHAMSIGRPCLRLPVISGRRPATSSPPDPAGRLSRASSTARSPGSPEPQGFASSGCTMPGTAARPCSPPPGSLPVS